MKPPDIFGYLHTWHSVRNLTITTSNIMHSFGLILSFLCIGSAFCEQYKILFLLPMSGKSHKNVFTPLMEGLAARGHEVTAMSPYKPTKTISNLKEIVIEDIAREERPPPSHANTDKAAEGEDATKNPQFMIKRMLGMNPLFTFKVMSKHIQAACKIFLNFPQTKEIIKMGKIYDLVVVQGFVNECALPVGTMVGKNVIYLSPPAMPGIGIGAIPRPPSYVTTTMVPLPSSMDFFQRMKNVFYSTAMIWTYNYYMLSEMQSIVSEFLPEAPTISESLKQIRFVLYNADPVLTPPHPGISNVVGVGAMHCKDAKPLPKDMEDFVQSSGEHGFIYFSLGSNIPSKMLPIEMRQAFISVFSRLKQKVIWKFEADLPDKPENVMITKWAPQQDILGHPKIRLFISHGGLLSMQETTYHGVPVVGIPILGDQPGNVFRMKELKIGEMLEFLNISETSVYEAVNRILNDNSYYTNMKKYSAILRDQPQKPLDRAIFWTEYVIRHNGALHLRPAGEDLNFIQYFLLDVVAFILSIVAVVAVVAVKLVKVGLKLWSKKANPPSDSKKTN